MIIYDKTNDNILSVLFVPVCTLCGFPFFLDVRKWHNPETKTIINPAIDDIKAHYPDSKNESEVSIDDVLSDTFTEIYAGEYCKSDS